MSPARSNCITEAARLVVCNEGEAERLLTVHLRREDGRCGGCGSHLIHWPCVMVAIARQAQELHAASNIHTLAQSRR